MTKLKLTIRGELVFDEDPRFYGLDTSPWAMADVIQLALRENPLLLTDRIEEMGDDALTITVEPVDQ